MKKQFARLLLAIVFMGASVWAYGTTVTVNDNTVGTGTNQFNYHGSGWSYGSASGAYDNDNHWDYTTNDYYTFQFSGQQAVVYGSMNTDGGIAAYSVDGGAETNFDDYAASRVDNVFLFATPILSSGTHTLKVRVTGLKNPSSSYYTLPADRIDVNSGLTAVTVNDNTVGTGSSQFNYQGSGWFYGSQSGAYDNDNHWDYTTNDYYTFQFNGTEAIVYGSIAPNGGIAAYSVDGGAETNFDDYAATRVDNVFLFATPIFSSGTHTLKVRVTGLKNPSSSYIVLAADRIDISTTSGGGTVATPTFSPAAGTYTSAQTVTISDSTSGATIYYTTDGSTPTTSSTVYSSPINVSTSETVKAIGVETGYTNSAVGSAAYTINLTVATPTFSPGAGTYSSAQTVTISDATSGATIHYTTDGSTPTTSSTTYSSPITVSTSETVKALGVKSGYTNSAVGSAAYVISSGGGKTVSSVLISPHGGVLQPGGTIQFSVQCTYTDSTKDNCAAAGGATWSVSSFSSTISSSGLYTEPVGTAWQPSHAYALGALVKDSNGYIEQAAKAGTSGSSITWPTPGGTDVQGDAFYDGDYFTDLNNSGYCPCGVVDGTVQWNLIASDGDNNFAVVTAGGVSDKAQVWRQMPGDTWYEYPTPATSSPGPNVVVGSTVTIGEGIVMNNSGGGVNGTPFQDSCTWSSSNTTVATVDTHGQVTGVSPGSVTITCGRTGNGNFSTSSSIGGWVSPGNATALTVVAGGTGNTTWYVRPDGGTLYSASNTSGQCSGKTNAAYPGSGTNQACAAGNIRYLWADGVTYQQLQWVISGGDTVIVAPNSAGYNTGLDQASPYANPPGTTWAPINCSGNPGCSMPPVPSGSATQHTRILGANYANCHADSAKTLLHVSYAGQTAFNVWGSQFVDIACFEITDEAACSDNGNFTNTCHNSNLNYGSDGIVESALSSDDTYTDLFIHGLGQDGIAGATGVGIVANYVHIRAMPDGGINMDDGPWTIENISVAGGLTMTNSTTEWTGCVEEYPVVHNYPYIECRDAETGGYGDGFGTASTTGNWIFDHDIWQFNYQDGLDLLHSGMQNLSVTNSFSQANDGQSFKIGSGDNVVFRNNIAMANCFRIGTQIGDEPAVYPGGYNLCRANGNLIFNFTNLGTYSVQDNTIVGTNNADTPVGLECEGGWSFCQNANAQFQNNLMMGYLDNVNPYSDGDVPGVFYLGNPDLVNQSFFQSTYMPQFNGWGTRNHNLFYNVRSGDCPTPLQLGETCNTADPMFVGEPASPISAESDLDNFNFKPSSSSPAVGAGIAIPGITTDYTGATRPNPPSIGAVE